MAIEIGVTGGIGSGKSTVVGFLHQCIGEERATVIDADAVAKSVTAPRGRAMPLIRQTFGAEAVNADGGMNRAYMRQLLSSDADAKVRLEAVTHPLIRQLMDELAAASYTPVILFDVPLLVEAGDAWLGRVDRVCVVDCPVETQVRRVQQRPGSADWNEEQIHSIIAMQASRWQRRDVADAVVCNSDTVTLAALRRACEQLCTFWGLAG